MSILIGSGGGSDSVNRSGCGFYIDEPNESDFCSILGTHHLVFLVVAAFGQDVGTDRFQHVDRCVFVEDDNVVDCIECGDEMGAVLLADDRSLFSFDSSHASVRVDANDQHITMAPRFSEEFDVASMQQVKTTVCEYDPFSLCLELLYDSTDFGG